MTVEVESAPECSFGYPDTNLFTPETVANAERIARLAIINTPSGPLTPEEMIQKYGTLVERVKNITPSPLDPNISFSYSIGETTVPTIRIGGINGIGNTLADALCSAEYLHSFAPDHSVDWVYNRTHTFLVDLAEVIFLNQGGISFNTAALLRKNWEDFHKANQSIPDAKYLQFCHSQGAIHTRNALKSCPVEIRNRVIVVAIGPGSAVSSDLCFKSFNYASKRDPVPMGELAFAGLFEAHELKTFKHIERTVEAHKELIWLEPHESAFGIDHSFQSKTFEKVIAKIIDDHIKKDGIYRS